MVSKALLIGVLNGTLTEEFLKLVKKQEKTVRFKVPTWEDIMREKKAEEESRKAALRKKGREQFKKGSWRKI